MKADSILKTFKFSEIGDFFVDDFNEINKNLMNGNFKCQSLLMGNNLNGILPISNKISIKSKENE